MHTREIKGLFFVEIHVAARVLILKGISHSSPYSSETKIISRSRNPTNSIQSSHVKILVYHISRPNRQSLKVNLEAETISSREY